MEKKHYKIIVTIVFIIILLFLNKTISNAATADISASSNDVKVGDSVNINVSINAITWNLKVNGSGVSDTIVGGNLDELQNKVTNKSYKLDTSKSGTYTIKLTGDVTDANGTPADISKSVTVKVSEKAVPTNPSTTEEPKQETPAQTAPNTTVPNTTTPTTQEPQKPAEPTFKEVNETVYVQTDSLNVRGTWSASGGQYGTLKKGDSVTRIGISTDKINGYVWSRISYNGKTAYVISSALTTTKPEEKDKEEEKSANKALKELTVENYELDPKFDSQTTKYSLTLKDGDKKLNIKATPEDEKATVDVTGNEDFKIGNNIVKITVTAEDGTTRIYTITVSKTDESGVLDMLKLSKLQIANATLQPSFDPETTSYVITVEDPSTIKKENVVAVAEDENVTVTVAENEQSENGEKIITIMLEDKDGQKTGVYQITVKKPVVNQMSTLQNNNDNSIYYILGGIIGGLIILIIIIIIVLKKTGDNDDDIDLKDEDELSDSYDYSLKGAIDEVNKNHNDFDEMVENSSFKSQILNSDMSKMKNKFDLEIDKYSEDENYQNDEDDFKPDITPKRKGKHF